MKLKRTGSIRLYEQTVNSSPEIHNRLHLPVNHCCDDNFSLLNEKHKTVFLFLKVRSLLGITCLFVNFSRLKTLPPLEKKLLVSNNFYMIRYVLIAGSRIFSYACIRPNCSSQANLKG